MGELKVGSLFSGVGAYEKAAKNIGIKTDIKFFCELDKTKSKAYSLLHNVDVNKNRVDVTKINGNELEDIDILFYSPPCQAYSVAGKKQGLNDIRGTLFYDAFKIIDSKKPKYCVMENVDNLPNKFTEVFNDMLKCLEKDYYTYWKLINAKDFLPQNRNRVFVVSIRKDIINKISSDYVFNFPTGKNNIDWSEYINPLETRELTGRQQRMVDYVKGNNVEDNIKIEGTPQFEHATIMLRQSGLRFQNNKEFPTLCAAMGKGGGNFPMIAHKGHVGGVTPRQCFKLMGFDYEDSDLLTKNGFSISSQYLMAGDSVCVPILEGIIREIVNIDDIYVTNK